MTEPPDETTRLDQLRQGHEPAFRWLVETYQQRMFRTALAIVANTEEAEDVAQEVFVEVFQTIRNFRGEAGLATWLYRLTTSRALKKERDRKRQKRFGFMTSLFSTSNDDKPDYDPPDFQTPGTLLETDEQSRQINRAVASLAESQRVAFTLHYQEELSYQEIAAVLQTSVSAVESLLFRARQTLRKKLPRP
ncbi:MAG: sigma-70 family RNA polymerase sigma factor [Spirosoma sp.]|nr:sigma-70 family RNA polymerase sigma factor [Spirosoma sp.]